MKKKLSSGKNNKRTTRKFVPRYLALLLLILGCVLILSASGLLTSKLFRTSAADNKDKAAPTQSANNNENQQISPEALSQIAALQREKESRTPAQQKIDSQLLYAMKMERGEPIAEGVPKLETRVQIDGKGYVEVDISAHVSDKLLARINELKGEIILSFPQYHSVTARLPLREIETLAELEAIIFIQPKLDATTNRSDSNQPATQNDLPVTNSPRQTNPFVVRPNSNASFQQRAQAVRKYLSETLAQRPSAETGSVNSEGDTTHRANSARAGYNVNGTGVRIGVLSDGVNTLAARQGTGDLPAVVTVLPGQAGSGDEGTAMLELVHDVAPGAQLYFATAFNGITSFAQNIRDLRTAGCDIIIDDVSYFVETPFQDGQAPSVISPGNPGVVVEAVNDVTIGSQAGALYFSSAANSGNKNDNTSGVWEGDFVDGGATAAPITLGNRLHDFGGGATFNTLTVAGRVLLKWSDPIGGSANDYDLYALNSTGTTVVTSATNIQDGNDDPVEDVGNRAVNQRMVIVKKTAAAARFLHLNTNRGRLANNTAGVVYGHNAGRNTISCAATPASVPFGAPPNPTGPFPNAHSASNTVELFSSDGPRRIFYQANGTSITPGNVSSSGGEVLAKPDITAADGTNTTTPGFIPFFGTSAAAPHAGALMALLKSASPGSTRTQLYNAMTSTAIDIEAAGYDRDSGYGIFMPIPAINALGGVTTYAFLERGTVTATEATGGNSNGNIDPGEIGNLTVQLNNTGLASATAISATLTTSTTGVTVLQPDTKSYPDIPASGNATNASPFRFRLANNFMCGATINFTLTVTYTGGANPSQTFNFTVKTGSPPFSITTTLDTTAPVSPNASITAATGTQTGRVNRFAPSSSCGSAKANPGLQTATGSRRYDSYTFTASASGCVQVSFINQCTGTAPAMYAVAYTGSFVPANPSTNYLADGGGSSTIAADVPFSFDVTSGQTYVVVAHEVTPAGATGCNYTLGLQGPIQETCTVAPNVYHPVLDFDNDGKSDFVIVREIVPPIASERTSKPLFSLMSEQRQDRWLKTRERLENSRGGGDRTINTAPKSEGGIPPSNVQWVIHQSGTNTTDTSIILGTFDDYFVPSDYDGDGRWDPAVWTPGTAAPNSGLLRVRQSSNGLVVSYNIGNADSDPSVVGDYDGDGRADPAVFNFATGNWRYLGGPTHSNPVSISLGQPNDFPNPGDFNGDGIYDFSLQRQAMGNPLVARFGVAFNDGTAGTDLTPDIIQNFGMYSFALVPGDYDGDTKTDIAQVNLGGTNIMWRVLQSSTAFTNNVTQVHGVVATDYTVQGDYDGDGKIDYAIWRPLASSQFRYLPSSGGAEVVFLLGGINDYPVGYYNSH